MTVAHYENHIKNDCQEVRVECPDFCGRWYKRKHARAKIESCNSLNGSASSSLRSDIGTDLFHAFALGKAFESRSIPLFFEKNITFVVREPRQGLVYIALCDKKSLLLFSNNGLPLQPVELPGKPLCALLSKDSLLLSIGLQNATLAIFSLIDPHKPQISALIKLKTGINKLVRTSTDSLILCG